MIRAGFGVTVLRRGVETASVDGIGSYTRALWHRLARRSDVSCLPFSYGAPWPDGYDVPSPVEQSARYARAAVRSAASGLSFPGTPRLRRELDLVHAPDHLIPKHRGLPVVATIMDAIPLSHPEWVSSRLRGAKTMLQRRTARWATHVVTISEYSRHEIAEHFRLPLERISVVPLGVDESWFELVPAERAEAVVQRYGLPERFFLFVGTLQPRKNLARVIEAIASLPVELQRRTPLVIVGNAGWESLQLIEALRNERWGSTVRWIGRAPEDDLRALMARATALVFPSLYEGFGLPVLEAFAAGVPVITSNTTALPEVAGDAALTVDPYDTEQIATAMRRVAEHEDIADELRRNGLARAHEFTWERTADMTVDVYRRVLGYEE